MSTQTAFHRGVHPLLQLLLSGKEEAVLGAQPDRALRERIGQLAAKSTEGELTAEERDEYEGYVRANKFVATLRREARTMKSARPRDGGGESLCAPAGREPLRVLPPASG